MKFRRIITLVYGSWFCKTLHCLQSIFNTFWKKHLQQTATRTPSSPRRLSSLRGARWSSSTAKKPKFSGCLPCFSRASRVFVLQLVRSGDGSCCILPANLRTKGVKKDIDLYTKNIYIYIYMRVVLNSFIWKTSSSPKKNSFAELSRTPCFSFAVHVGEYFSEKRGCVISSNCSRRLIPRHTSFCGSCT